MKHIYLIGIFFDSKNQTKKRTKINIYLNSERADRFSIQFRIFTSLSLFCAFNIGLIWRLFAGVIYMGAAGRQADCRQVGKKLKKISSFEAYQRLIDFPFIYILSLFFQLHTVYCFSAIAFQRREKRTSIGFG